MELLRFYCYAIMIGTAASVVAGGELRTMTNSIGMTFVFVPPGTFVMGSPESEEGRKADERQRQITFTNGFWLSRTEVTRAQWRTVMGPLDQKAAWDDDYPAINVSFRDAVRFCRKLTLLDAHCEYRLPTEAEWEYACRAGSQGPYCCGPLESMANFFYSTPVDARSPINPVGSKKPNRWGLFDMHGNVAEWTSTRTTDVRVIKRSSWYVRCAATNHAAYRIVKGGSYVSLEEDLRCAARICAEERFRGTAIGFRVVAVPCARIGRDEQRTGTQHGAGRVE